MILPSNGVKCEQPSLTAVIMPWIIATGSGARRVVAPLGRRIGSVVADTGCEEPSQTDCSGGEKR